LNFNTI